MNRKLAIYNTLFFSLYSVCMAVVLLLMWKDYSDISWVIFGGCRAFLIISSCVAVVVSGLMGFCYVKGQSFLDDYQYEKVCFYRRLFRAVVIILFVATFAVAVLSRNFYDTITGGLIAGWICLLVETIMELVLTKKK